MMLAAKLAAVLFVSWVIGTLIGAGLFWWYLRDATVLPGQL